jgi:hypothetical protein
MKLALGFATRDSSQTNFIFLWLQNKATSNLALNVILCLPLHIHDGVENVLKHFLFNVHDVKVMAEQIDLLIRKLLKDTSLYPIMGQTKTRKLLLT